MKAGDYRRLAAGAVVDALHNAGDQLGAVESITVDGVEVNAAEALDAYKSASAEARAAVTGGAFAQRVDVVTDRTAGKLAKAVDGFSRWSETTALGKLIPREGLAKLQKNVRLDPERVSAKSLVEVRFAGDRIEPFAVEAVNLAATATLQRSSLVAGTGSAILPIVGSVFPAGGSLMCLTGAITATVRGDMPAMRANLATGAKQLVLAGVSMLPAEPITPAAAVIDARNLNALKRWPSVANVVHLGEELVDGKPIVPRDVPNLALRPAIRDLLLQSLPDSPDKSIEAQDAFRRRIDLLEKSGSLERDDAKTLRGMLDDWGGFDKPDLWVQALNSATGSATSPYKRVDDVLSAVLARAEHPGTVEALRDLAAQPGFQSLQDAQRASTIRMLSRYVPGPSAGPVASALAKLVGTKSFAHAKPPENTRLTAEDMQQRMGRLVAMLADVATTGAEGDRPRAQAALSLLLDDARFDLTLMGKQQGKALFAAEPAAGWKTWVPFASAKPQVSLRRNLLASSDQPVRDRAQQERILKTLDGARASLANTDVNAE